MCFSDPPGRISSACTVVAETLTDQAIDEHLRDREWEREGDAIVRERTFEDFNAAVAFVNRVAEAAEAANHHPDITIHGYNKVKLTLSTHSAGGITQADFHLAEALDRLA
jgi:4a-hydroxytetrahydrobiopterin dehydratase